MLSSGSYWAWALVLIVTGVILMGCKDAGSVCLFSRMSGVITLDGKPVANARLVRTVQLSKKQEDENSSDNKE